LIRRRALLGGLAGLASVRRARAEDGVYLLVGVSAGSTNDRIARDFASCLAEHLGEPVFPVDRPGNGGRDMLAALGAAPATGAAVGWVTTPTLPARMVDRSEPALAERIRLLGQIQAEPVAFVSQGSDPSETVQDIVRRAGEDADAVPLATPPAGSAPHLAVLRLQQAAQTRLNIVTFPSSAAARRALSDGTVSAAALALSEVIDPVRDGSFVALGIAAHKRFGLLPDTPVLDEGAIPLRAFIRRGLGVPLGTPEDVVARLVAGMRAVASDDAYREKAEASGVYVSWADGAAWAERMRAEEAVLRGLWGTDPWLSASGE
jgi:tripartite-type tricarboxylate transporter receptor subunit TctC